jgi:hypothetical protein
MQSESLKDEIELKRESDSKLKVLTDEMKNDPFRFADDSDVETESETRLVFRFKLFFRDEVVLSKTVLSNFRPKQANEWIGDPMASLFQLFIAFLT